MTPRHLSLLGLAVAVSIVVARPARADDAANAAAAMAAIGQAGMGNAGGAGMPPGGGPGQKGKGDNFSRPLTAPHFEHTADSDKKPAAKKGAKPKKAKDSKYKSTVLTENTESNYRFNERGEPLGDAAKKKTAAKKKVSSDEENGERPAACSTETPCTDKNPDADAL